MEKHGSRSIPKPSYMAKKHGAPQPARPKFKKIIIQACLLACKLQTY